MKEKRGEASAPTWLVPELSVMSRRCRYIYINNFKAGCSTVRRSLWNAEYQLGHTATSPGDPHDVSHVPFEHNAHARWEGCEDKFIFTFVRNPYARVLSAYLDKIANLHEPYIWPRFSAEHGLGDRRPSFPEFLEILTTDIAETMDPHWRPQSLVIAYGLVPFDFIGTLENFGPDLREATGRIFGHDVPIEDFAPHRTGAAEQLATYITPNEQRLILRLYEADFVNFGYGESLETLRSTGFKLRRASREPMRAWGRSARLYASRDYAGAHQAFEDLASWGEWPYLGEARAISLREVGKAKRQRGVKELRRLGRRGWGNRGDAGLLPLLSDLLSPTGSNVAEVETKAVDLGIAELRLAAKLLPTDMVAHKQLGLALLAVGELEDGIETLIRGASLGETGVDKTSKQLRHYRRRLAVLRARRGGHEAGLDVLRAAGSAPVALADRFLVSVASLAGKAFATRAQAKAIASQ